MLTALKLTAEITEDGILQITAPVIDMTPGLYEVILVLEDRQPAEGLKEMAPSIEEEEWGNIIPLHREPPAGQGH